MTVRRLSKDRLDEPLAGRMQRGHGGVCASPCPLLAPVFFSARSHRVSRRLTIPHLLARARPQARSTRSGAPTTPTRATTGSATASLSWPSRSRRRLAARSPRSRTTGARPAGGTENGFQSVVVVSGRGIIHVLLFLRTPFLGRARANVRTTWADGPSLWVCSWRKKKRAGVESQGRRALPLRRIECPSASPSLSPARRWSRRLRRTSPPSGRPPPLPALARRATTPPDPARRWLLPPFPARRRTGPPPPPPTDRRRDARPRPDHHTLRRSP